MDIWMVFVNIGDDTNTDDVKLFSDKAIAYGYVDNLASFYSTDASSMTLNQTEYVWTWDDSGDAIYMIKKELN